MTSILPWRYGSAAPLRQKLVGLPRVAALLVGIVLAFLTGSLYAIASTVLLGSFAAVEQQTVKRDVERVLDSISNELSSLGATARDYATWDDTYEFAATADPAYVELNLGETTFSSFGLNLIAVTNSAGQIVFGQEFDLEAAQPAPLAPQLQQTLTPASPLLALADENSATSGFLVLPDGILMITSQPILTSDGTGPLRGALIMGRYLNQAEIQRLSDLTRVPLSIYVLSDKAIPQDVQQAQAQISSDRPIAVAPLNHDAIAGYALLPDLSGQPSLMVAVNLPRVIYRQGMLSLRYLGLSLVAIGGICGTVVWWLLRQLVRHVTEREGMARALAEEERFRKIFEDAPIGMAIIHPDSRLLMQVNRALCTMLGYHPAELVGRLTQTITHTADGQDETCLQDDLKDDLSGGAIAIYQGEKRYVTKAGDLLWGHLTTTLIGEPGHNDTYRLAMVENITDRKQVEAALQTSETQHRQKAEELAAALEQLQQTQAKLVQTEKMSSLGRMVAGLAHEVNNPINFIHGNLGYVRSYSQTLLQLIGLYQQRCPEPDEVLQAALDESDIPFLAQDLPKCLSSMQAGTERVRSIILALRLFSRLDEANSKVVNLHDGLDSTLMMLNNRLESSIDVIRNYGQIPPILCCPAQLNQAFANLMENAIDALNTLPAHAPKQIAITTQVLADDLVQVCLQDNGPGIAPDIRDKIFDPFFTTKPIGQGTGLGLTACYQIIHSHGGQITVSSQPGEGAVFTVTLPLQEISAAAPFPTLG